MSANAQHNNIETEKSIYRFKHEEKYRGHVTHRLDGIFISSSTAINAIMGVTLYFGKEFGQLYADGYDFNEVVVTKENVELVTSDQIAVSNFEKYQMETGINPLNYLDVVDGYEDSKEAFGGMMGGWED